MQAHILCRCETPLAQTKGQIASKPPNVLYPAGLDQLKRYKRFDNFIMLVWDQGSTFHIAARSHPVQEA